MKETAADVAVLSMQTMLQSPPLCCHCGALAAADVASPMLLLKQKQKLNMLALPYRCCAEGFSVSAHCASLMLKLTLLLHVHAAVADADVREIAAAAHASSSVSDSCSRGCTCR